MGKKRTHVLVLTDVNVSWVVWSEWRWMENTYACVFPFFFFLKMCASLTEAAGAETHSRANSRHEQPRGKPRPSLGNFSSLHSTICVCLCCAFYLNLFAHSCEHAFFFFPFSEGEVKERRLLMQVITATVSCLVCSKSSGTPLGKMRGLITVKLANEQVNYRTKFLYKNCHFSLRDAQRA